MKASCVLVALLALAWARPPGATATCAYSAVAAWGTAPGPGQLALPYGIAIDGSGHVVVVDTYDGRIVTFDAAGNFLGQFGTQGPGAGQFEYPQGVAIDHDGNIFVADTANFRIQKFDPTGLFVTSWSAAFNGYPGYVAVDGSGNVFVSDTGDTIWKFDNDGNPVTSWGGSGSGPGQLNQPDGIAVDANDHVFVVDTLNNRVQEFTGGGAFVAAWGSAGTAPGQFGYAYGVAIDGQGDVFVSDIFGIDRVQQFTAAGGFIASFGGHGTALGKLSSPAALAVDTAGNVYVADTNNSRVEKFSCLPAATCGDGIVQAGEQCDDGIANGTASSCCTATCALQPSGAACTNGAVAGLCTGGADVCAACGDGVTEAGELCDDGASNGSAGSCCAAGCTLQPSGTACTTSGGATGTCTGSDDTCAGCGDGILVAGEQCDDGAANGTPNACCTAACALEAPNVPCTAGECTGGSDVCLVPAYVAIGDSTTTGFSVPTCHEDRATSPVGCVGVGPATPYPERVAIGEPAFVPVYRLGIWGYTIDEAVMAASQGHDATGPWEPQLLAVSKATKLVTVSLGANDMDFSDVLMWAQECVQFALANPNSCEDAATNKAENLRFDIQAMMDRLDVAQQNGATVVVVLYYNPYNDQKDAGPFGVLSRDCGLIHNMSEIIVGALDNVLQDEAQKHGFLTVDLRPAFRTHGAGSNHSYVFGSDCDVIGGLGAITIDLGWPPVGIDEGEIKQRFDPHPNDEGTAAQADEILKVVP